MRFKIFFFLCVLLLLWPLRGHAQGRQIKVCAAASPACDYDNSHVQDAINAAVEGDEVLVQSGFTYIAPADGYVLGTNCHSLKYDCIVIRTGVTSTGTVMGRSSFPADGVRMTTAYRGTLAKFIPQYNQSPTFRTIDPGENWGYNCSTIPCLGNGWTLKWLEIGPKDDWLARALIRFGSSNEPKAYHANGTTCPNWPPAPTYIPECWTNEMPNGIGQDMIERVPRYLSLIQSDVHGHETKGQFQGVRVSSREVRIIGNSITKMMSMLEGQTIILTNSLGPFDIENNYLESGSETVMWGGQDTLLRLQARVTGSPTTTSVPMINPVWWHFDRSTTPANWATDIYNGQYISINHGGAEWEGIKCVTMTVATGTCTISPALPFTPVVGDVVSWQWMPGGITFKYNWVMKPLSERGPILAAPTGLAVAHSATSGSLTSAIYCYTVQARAFVSGISVGETVYSPVPTEQCVNTSGSVVVTWNAVTGADSYRVYGRVAGAQDRYWVTDAATRTYTDTGTTGTVVAYIGAGETVNRCNFTNSATEPCWNNKNNFEIKGTDGNGPIGPNLVEYNVFENAWGAFQDNIISLKVNNQNDGWQWYPDGSGLGRGGDTAGTTRGIMFRNNWVKNGSNYLRLSCNNLAWDLGGGPMEDMHFENNLWTGLNQSYSQDHATPGVAPQVSLAVNWGSYQYQVPGSRACNTTSFIHNTFLSDSAGGKNPWYFSMHYDATADKMSNFTLRDNIMPQDATDSGAISDNNHALITDLNDARQTVGTYSWNFAMDTGTSSATYNVWPESNSSRNSFDAAHSSWQFPTMSALRAKLVDYTACVAGTITGCKLIAAGTLSGVASDSTDVGADIDAIKVGIDIAISGGGSGGGGSGSGGPPTYVSSVSGDNGSGATTVDSSSLTASGTNRYLLCGVTTTTESGTFPAAVTGVTFNSVAMTFKDSAEYVQGGAYGGHLDFYGMPMETAGIGAGASSVVTASLNASAKAAIGCSLFAGVDQATPYSGLVKNQVFSYTTNVTVASNSNEVVVSLVGANFRSFSGSLYYFPNNTESIERVQHHGTSAGMPVIVIASQPGVTSTATNEWFTWDGAAVQDVTVGQIGISLHGGIANIAPTVSAGSDDTVTYPAAATLNGTVTDDGFPNPPATVTTTWTKQSGPGTVTFGNASLVDTTATFSVPGTYVLQLSASDGALTTTDLVTVVSGLSVVTGMPTLVTTKVGETASGGTVSTASLTPTGTNRYLACGIATGSSDTTNATVSGVTFGGQNLTFRKADENYQGGAPGNLAERVEYWDLIAPATSANVITATLSYTTEAAIGCVLYADVDQTIPTSTFVSTNNRTEYPGISMTGSSNDVIIDMLGINFQLGALKTASVNVSGQTQLFQQRSSAATYPSGVMSSRQDGGGAGLIQWHIDDATNYSWAQVAVAIRGSGAISNVAPTVDAGLDAAIVLPTNTTFLNGTVSDDGLPNPPAFVAVTWAQQSGAGTATFNNPNAIDTIVTFSAVGTYVLRLTASDSVLSAYDDVTVVVSSITNVAPVVSAGPDLTTTLPAGVNLNGTVTDDGNPNPPAAITYLWTKQSGPGTVTFGVATNVDTTATFSLDGTYVLRLTASDSVLSTSDDMSVSVAPAPAIGTIVRADNFLLNQGKCFIKSGAGPPGALNGCDVYVDATNGRVYGQSSQLNLLTAASDLTLDPIGNNVLPAVDFDIALGSPTLMYKSLDVAELHVKTLVAQDVISTIGGTIEVGETTELILALGSASGDLTIHVKHNQMRPNDIIWMRSAPGGVQQTEYMVVVAGPSGTAGDYTYTVTRDLDGTGRNAWKAGDAILNTGQIGTGIIDLYSRSGFFGGAGPSLVGMVRTSTVFNGLSARYSLGNLNGFYGYATNTFGAAFGDYSTNGTWVTIEPTLGLRMGHGVIGSGGKANVTIDPAGNATFDGSVTVGTSRNLIRNSECRVSTDDWAVADVTGGSGGATTFALAFDPWRLLGESNGCYVNKATTPSAGAYVGVYTPLVAAKPGQVYEASVYVGSHRETSRADLQFIDSVGVLITEPTGNTCGEADGVGGPALAGYCRTGIVATAPAGTASVRLIVYAIYDGAQAGPYLFFTRAYLGEGRVGQTQLSEWGPAGITEITGGIIKTDAITARTIAADSITSAKIVAGTIQTSDIGANSITTALLDADSVTSAKIAAGTIVASDIASGTITATQIAANTITASQIAAGTITATEIAANTITAGKLNVSSLSAISADLGTVTAGSITGLTISGGTVTGGSGNITLNSSGLHFSGNGGNAVIDLNGQTLEHSTNGGGGSIWTSGRIIADTGLSGAEVNTTSVNATDHIYYTNSPGSTGTALILDTGDNQIKRNTSSLRYKENIRTLEWTDALSILRATPIRYDYRNGGAKNVVGLSAEDLFAISPDLVNLDALGRPDSLRQETVNVYLLEAMKALREELDKLKSGGK